MIQDRVIQLLKDAASNAGFSTDHIVVEHPQSLHFGDYACNIAMRLASETKQNPRAIAEQIVSSMPTGDQSIVESVSIAGPGFINLSLKPSILAEDVNGLLNKKKVVLEPRVGAESGLEMYENTGPNTNKPLHIGHIRNMALGTSVVQLRTAVDAKAWSVNINNDRGAHICKAMLGYLYAGHNNQLFDNDTDWQSILTQWIENPGNWKQPEAETDPKKQKPDRFVGQFYIEGHNRGEESQIFQAAISGMLQAWEANDQEVRQLWQTMNNWFYQGFKQTHARFLGISPEDQQFDKEYYESDLYEAGRQMALNDLNKGLFVKRENNTIVADLEKYGLPDKVIIRSDGTSLYITQDLELARRRIQEDRAHFIAYVVANEQDLQFKQLFAICEVLGLAKREQFLHISYGMVNLKGGEKMSSRKGTVIYADDLMDMVKAKVQEAFPDVTDDTAEHVAIGAIKYWMLKYNPKADIEFDIEQSVSLQGNSGPYLQYTYARTRSVLSKAASTSSYHLDPAYTDYQSDELTLLRLLYRYPEIVIEAADKYAPQLLATFLFEIAQQYNTFYQNQPILKAEPTVMAQRLALTEAVSVILEHGLKLLGVPVIERM